MKFRHALVVGALAAVTAVTGCSSGGDPATVTGQAGPDPATQEADAQAPVSSSKLLAAIYFAQLKKQSVTMTTEITGGTVTAAGSGSMRITEDGFAADLRIEMPDAAGGEPRQARLIVLPDEGYLQFPGTVPGDKWVKITPSADDPLSASFKPMFEEFAKSADPTQAFDVFGDIEMTPVGAETINGVTTTKYTGTVGIEHALESVDPPKKDELEQMLAEGVADLDIALWVDAEDLIHRAVTSMEVGGETVTVTTLYSKWGEPVEIEIPAPADIASLPDLGG